MDWLGILLFFGGLTLYLMQRGKNETAARWGIALLSFGAGMVVYAIYAYMVIVQTFGGL